MSRLSRDRRDQYRRFNVLIYEEDYKQLCAWVLKKPNIETGGDLFGLWADKHTAVIQLVLGPGQGCTRTSVSFYQDVNYLERVGSYLTQNEGVCHIGEWHSHHQLGLAQPSGGDENTVWNNMPTYKLKRFVIFIANIRPSRQHYNVNIGCFLFEIDDHGNRLAVLPGEFMILQKENPLSLKQEVLKERSKNAEMDKMTTITIKDLKLEVKGERNSQPSVTYLKPSPTPSKKRNREKKNQLQAKNQDANKADDEERCEDSKKPKMDTGASYPTTAGRSPGGRSSSPSGSLISKDLQNLTIDGKQLDEQPVLEMEVDEKKEQPEKKEEEETVEDNNGKNSRVKNQNQDQESAKERSEEEEEENKDEIMKMNVNREAHPSEGDQGKPKNKNGENESQPPQGSGPLPKLGKETTPTEQTGRQALEVNKKDSAAKEGRPLPQLKEETTPSGKTGQQTLQADEKVKTKDNLSKGSAAQGGGLKQKLGHETTSAGQTGRRSGTVGQTKQVKEQAKTNADQSKGSASRGGKPPPQQARGKTPAKTTGKPLKTDSKAERSNQQSSGKKAGSSGSGKRKGK